MSKDNRTNVWGWLGLILVVGLIGVGFLYQREGGRLFGVKEENVSEHAHEEQEIKSVLPSQTSGQQAPQVPQAVGPAPISPAVQTSTEDTPPAAKAVAGRRRSEPGTVNVVLKTEGNHWLVRGGPWVYVDGLIVEDLHEQWQNQIASTKLSLTPESHFVEAVAYGTMQGPEPVFRTEFVLNTRGQYVSLEPGGEASLEFSFPALYCRPDVPTDPFRFLLGMGCPPEEIPADWRRWVELREVRADQQMQLFESDSLTRTLKELKASLGNQRPKSPTVMLDIPPAYGGRREVNAFQVDLIVCWLALEYWQDFPAIRPTLAIDDGEQDLRGATIPPLEKRIEQYLERIQELQSISQQLRLAQ